MVALFGFELVALFCLSRCRSHLFIIYMTLFCRYRKGRGDLAPSVCCQTLFGNLKCLDLSFLSYLAVDDYLGEALRF